MTTLKMIDDELLLVNHKEVRYTMHGNWVPVGFDPTLEEAHAVAEFVLMKKRFGKIKTLEMTF